MRFIPKHETVQKYGAILPDTLTNQAMKELDAYKTYHDFATGKVIPKPKYVWRSTREKTDQAPTASPEIALSEAEQMKIVTKRSKTQFHSSHASGSCADEGTGISPGVPDVPTYGSEDEQISWKSSDGMMMMKLNQKMMVMTLFIPSSPLMIKKKRQDEEDKKEEGSDLRVQTASHFESTDDETCDEVTQGDNVEGEELDKEDTNEDGEVNELYKDVNVNLEGRATEMTDALLANVQTTQVIEDTHVIITTVTPEVQQQSSSVSSGFISNMLNPNLDTGIDSILNLNTESTSLVDVPATTNVEMPPSSVTTLPPPPIPLVQPQQQTPVPTPTIIPSTSLQNLPTFGSLFKFEHKVKALEDDFSEFKQTNLFAEAVSSIPGIVDTYLANKINEAVKTVVQLQSDRLRDEAQAENEEFILPRIEKSVNEQLKAEVLIRSSNEAKTSHAVAINLSELELKKILIDKIENNKSIDRSDTITLKRRRDDEDEDEEPSAGSNRGSKRRRAGKEPDKSAQAEEPIHADEDLEEPAHQEFDTGFTEDQPIDETTQHPDWFQKPTKPPTPDRDWNKTLPAKHGPVQPWISTLAQNEDPCKSFNELMDTPLDFSAFVLNQLKVDTLTPELLAGPIFELMKVMKTKAVDYEHTKWIEDLVPNTMWSQVPIVYDKHALWGISHWARKRQQFYGFAVNRESARDVYFRNKIIGIKKLTIVEWHNYKYLEWITVRRDDDKLYTFKEDDYNRLRLQDIEDMLLLLVQGKLTNLNIKERLALGVSLRMLQESLSSEGVLKIFNWASKNKDKKNRLMRIDELYKFSNGTLNDVRYALDDILKRIRMEYFPQTVWRNIDRERAGAMIQAIN
ncbi:hypothetical protein Tco_1315408 [Tanacetum coccineum]